LLALELEIQLLIVMSRLVAVITLALLVGVKALVGRG
jgi:hypothetical protein